MGNRKLLRSRDLKNGDRLIFIYKGLLTETELSEKTEGEHPKFKSTVIRTNGKAHNNWKVGESLTLNDYELGHGYHFLKDKKTGDRLFKKDIKKANEKLSYFL